MKIVMIVQARMTSTRLPGKVLKPVLGKPLLEYQLDRLRRVTLADDIVIATTVNPSDQPIVALCERLSLPYYRGSEEDVLSRYYATAIAHQGDAIVRVTSDCPLIDPGIIDQVINKYLQSHIQNTDRYDYVSNTLHRSYPRGMDTEIFSILALQEAYREAIELSEREHVTPFIYCRAHRYHLGSVTYGEDCSNYRWTVDTPADFELIQRMLVALSGQHPQFTLEDCLALCRRYPEWSKINQNVEQKQ